MFVTLRYASFSHRDTTRVALNARSWEVVTKLGVDPPAYSLALRQAERAVQLAPWQPSYLNTLALALYRVGRYDEALAAVSKAAGARRRRDETTLS